MNEIVLSEDRKHKVQLAFKIYWLSPFCAGTIELGEPLLSWALGAVMLGSKAFADAYDNQQKIAYQIKTGLPTSPVTLARLTTPSQASLVNSDKSNDMAVLARELLEWVRNRIQEPRILLGATETRIARIIYTKSGDFTYYERSSNPDLFLPEDYTWKWSEPGNALELYRKREKWFAWYPQGRRATKNQNQLHFPGENVLIPPQGAANRCDFQLGRYGQLSFDTVANALMSLIDDA